MPLYKTQIPTGTDFDGTGAGALDFGTRSINDTMRAVVMSAAVQNDGTGTQIPTIRVWFADSLSDAQSGEGLEVLAGNDVAGMFRVGCNLIVPAGWRLFAVTGGASNTVKNLIVDWRRVDVRPML